jgi:hypothetical protein
VALDASNEHGRQMHDAVVILEEAAVVFAVAQEAIAAALKVFMRADDSSGIVGDARAATVVLAVSPRAGGSMASMAAARRITAESRIFQLKIGLAGIRPPVQSHRAPRADG